MTLHFADGFDHYRIFCRPEGHEEYDPEGSQVLRKWDAWHLDGDDLSLLSTGALGSHENAMRYHVRLGPGDGSGGGTGWLAKVMPVAGAEWTVGFALWVGSALPAGDAGLCSWHAAGGGGDGPLLGLDSGGELFVDAPGGGRLATYALEPAPFTYTYVEWRVRLGGEGVGQYEVRVAGHPVLTGTADTAGDGPLAVDELRLGTTLSVGGQWGYDDLYVTAPDGGRHQGFLCPPDFSVIVFPYVPVADQVTSLTPYENGVEVEGGFNYASLHEMEHADDDFTTNEGGGVDLFTLGPYGGLFGEGDPDVTELDPVAVQWNACFTGSGALARYVTVEGEAFAGPEVPAAADWRIGSDILETDPRSGADWTAEAFQALAGGYQADGDLRVTQLCYEAIIGLSPLAPPLPAGVGRGFVLWWP